MVGNQQRGVSLLELAILVAITSTLAVSFLSWSLPPAATDADKLRITNQRMDTINNAIATFRVRENRLPCPANATLQNSQSYTASYSDYSGSGGSDVNSMNFDDESLAVDGSSVSCMLPTGGNATVPTRALGLPSDMMYDGWGRKFAFAVNPNLCGDARSGSSNGCNPHSYAITPSDTLTGVAPNYYSVAYQPNLLKVNNGSGGTIASEVAYTLTSYGADGFCGYLPSGTQFGNTIVSNINETQNCSNSSILIQAAPSLTNDLLNRFDDIVTYRTKAQLDSMVSDTTTPLVDQPTCKNNAVIGIASLTKANATTVRNNITGLRTGPSVTATDIVANAADSSFTTTTTDLSIFSAGDTITTSGFDPVAGNNNKSFQVLNSATHRIAVSGALVNESPASASLGNYNNNGDEAILEMMWALQDVCNHYYGTVTATNIAVTDSSTLTFSFNQPNLAKGSLLYSSGFTNSINNNITHIASVTPTTIVIQETNLTVEVAGNNITLNNSFYGTFTGTNISVTGPSTYTIPTGINQVFTSGGGADPTVESEIYISGFSNASNNGIFHISGMTPTTISIQEGTLTTEPAGLRVKLISNSCPGNLGGSPGGAGMPIYSYIHNTCSCPNGTWMTGATCTCPAGQHWSGSSCI